MNLLLILCFTGMMVPVTASELPTIPHHYDLTMTQMTWSSAQSYCNAKNTDLAIIESDTDMLRLTKVATSKALNTFAWLGAQRVTNTWYWSLNNAPLSSVPYVNWGPGEPDNGGGNEGCAAIDVGGIWNDLTCTDIYPFICYNEKFTGAARFIGMSSLEKSWYDAQTYCQTYHTDLASAPNSSDNSMLNAVTLKQGRSWFGLRRDMWKWPDGTFVSHFLWGPHQPDNYGGTENCLSIKLGQYYDSVCTSLFSVFCDTDFPKRQQRIKLQVKSDRSVFNPAVQSSVLEQIKQILQENGMLGNTTVMWEVQPDGNIFHKQKKNVP